MATADQSSQKEESLTFILKELKNETDGDQVTMDDVLDAIDNRGFGPLLLIPAIIAVSPVGAIPGMSIVTGLILFLVAVQMIVTSGHPWLPDRLLEFEFSRDKLCEGIEKVLPWTKWFEQFVKHRLSILVSKPFHYMIAAIICLLSISFIPLAMLPFAVAIPGTAVAFFALALTAKDGAMVIVGLVFTAITVGVTVAFWPF